MFRTVRTITDYRGLGGIPKRGVCEPSKATWSWVQLVHRRSSALRQLSKRSLLEAADTLRNAIRSGDDAFKTDSAIESFALTAEALRRAVGWEYHDTQLAAGFALAAGAIAEVQTGEGKTIIAALPATLHAWYRGGVHVATTNAYLSGRDHETLRPVYAALGLTSGCLHPQQDPQEKRDAYACDVTYGPGYEFGFDFLRDQILTLQRRRLPLGQQYLQRLAGKSHITDQAVQRGLSFAIVDEADSVMIDEAMTPLIVSGQAESRQTDPMILHQARQVACSLQSGSDYQTEIANRHIVLTESGLRRVMQKEEQGAAGDMARRWDELVTNALRAEYLMQRDIDYVIKQGCIVLVDPNTGRLHPERRWSGGLQQAVEAKEELSITPESATRGRITRQRYLGLYPRLAGMTGTAVGSEAEFREFYRLPVVQIAPHQPCRRSELPLLVFESSDAKRRAIVRDTIARIAVGQPVLIGTASIHQSRQVAQELRLRGIEHAVLNGVQDEREAEIVARAGTAGQVTVATNMAGRGTDIRLDEAARSAGGLHVIATEMHLCARVDRQLIGRTARQGDPGSCQFFVAADDPLVQRYDPNLAARMREVADGSGQSRGDVCRALLRLQRIAESDAWQRRRQLVAHDDWFESVQSSFARRA